MELREQIAAVISEVLNADFEEIKNISGDETLNRIGVDSVNFIDVIISLEDKFNITFDDEELLLQNLNTINKLYKIISEKLGNA